MRTLFPSDFVIRFAGGFALGAVAVFGMHPGAVVDTLHAVIGTLTDVARIV